MNIELTSQITVNVKVLQGKCKGQTLPLTITFDDLLDRDLSSHLIEKGVFDYICNPRDYYKVVFVELLEG